MDHIQSAEIDISYLVPVVAIVIWIAQMIIKFFKNTSSDEEITAESEVQNGELKRKAEFRALLEEYQNDYLPEEIDVRSKNLKSENHLDRERFKNFDDELIERTLSENKDDLYNTVEKLKHQKSKILKEPESAYSRSTNYRIKKKKKNAYAEALKNPSEARKAIVLSEILKRKF